MGQGLTEQDLAERVGTSYSQISRIESGRHTTSINMLRRITHSLDLKFVLAFQREASNEAPEYDLVAF